MALISLRQLLDHAAEHGYGVPAFNVNNLEQTRAIMEAADETDSPVIMQASAGARKYAGAPFLRALMEAAEAIAASEGFSLAGGGDTLAAIDLFDVASGVSYISTGGGAFLEYVEGKELPAVAALRARADHAS